MGKVFLEGYLEVPADRVEAVQAALPDHIALTRAEPGCLAFSVARSPEDPTRFLVSETFADQAAFDAHPGPKSPRTSCGTIRSAPNSGPSTAKYVLQASAVP